MASDNLDQKGYLLIRDLWQRGTKIIHGMRFVNPDALYHRNKSLEKYLHLEKK